MREGTVVVNRKEQQTYELALEVIGGRLTLVEMSVLIGKSYRQTQRILKKIQQRSLLGVKHGNLGRTPANKIDERLKQEVLSLLKTRYFDFNLAHFREKLLADEGIRVNRESLRKWAKAEGLVKRAKRRSRKVHKPRPRMPRAGQLVQFDGSEHDWFSGSGPICTLLGGIDDATGEILSLEFFPAEDTFSCLKCVHDIVAAHGLPEALYVDQGKCFGKVYREQSTTQLGRALEELGCQMILASSPQAKGRIERLWNTLQDRLIAELRLHGINRIPVANEFLRTEFICGFNKRFSVPARERSPAYKKLPIDSLRDVFCIKESRKIGSGNVFSFENRMLVVQEQRNLKFRTVTVRSHYDGSIDYAVHGKRVLVQDAPAHTRATLLRTKAA
jgi:transposase InsO family protein